MGHPPLENEELERNVRAAQQGDERALAWLIEHTQRRLYRFFMVLTGNRREAEDFCQETFIKALEHLKSLKEPKSFLGWLFRTGKNLFLDHVRSPRSEEATQLDEVLESGQAATHTDLDLVLQTNKALNALEPEEHVILLLIDLEEHSYSEAAEIIGISESAVRSRLHRARQAFRERFEKT